ncbi:E3 ubiquitin-protein ligase ATL4-like [Phalaenopsis equestris]|uniref:E3 ubiquitin-protein ligase ATL4-like n=1 Tax=Phalaenopsis equestris TaxID=78828 RepID=UPI0009E2FCCE|nr:E3 ubiquitin-protein ligase ATL4-like [Phalaenopsis equestris]
MQGLLDDLKVDQQSLMALCDNQSAIFLNTNPVHHTYTKHLDVRYRFVQDLIDDNKVLLKKIEINNNPVVMLIKVLEEEEEKEKEVKLKPKTGINAMLAFPSPPFPSPPTPPQPPPSPPSPPSPASSVSGDGHSSAPSLIIIVGIIAIVITASASIHLFLRLISRSRSSSSASSSSSSSPPSPIPLLLSVAGNDSEPPLPANDRDQLISSLPIFTFASSFSAYQKPQSLDCAVCLSNFRPHDELRFLPACRHAFHSQCVDTWLRSTPSCPLCRASIRLPPAAVGAAPPAAASDPSRSGSFRVELGSVSRRRPSADGIPSGHGRSYSLGSSFDYLVDEEVEAVVERLRRAPVGKPENGIEVIGAPPPPGSEVAENAGNGGRGWLRDCVDRLTSSASSSFNSLRFSGRIGSHHFDPSPGIVAGNVDRSWDLEASGFVEWEEESGFGMLYRWLVGV